MSLASSSPFDAARLRYDSLASIVHFWQKKERA
jgi:hypothetical protein